MTQNPGRRLRRLVASGLLPERAGQPVRVWAHVSLAELRALDDGSVLAQEWVGEMAVRWAARRAAASQAGGCDQPAAACEVHHVTHLADGGKTSVDGCALFCFFHHQVAIHQWGWTVTLHPDGTTTASSPDGSKILRSHGPPSARAG